MYVCKYFIWNTFNWRKGPPFTMRLCGSSLLQVMNGMFSWFQENKTKSCVPERSKRCLTLLFFAKLTTSTFSVNTSQQPFICTIIATLTLHVLCSLNYNAMTWVVPVLTSDLLINMWGAQRTVLFPHTCSWFCHPGFLLCNNYKRKLRYYWALSIYIGLNFILRNKRFDMWRTFFVCQRRLEWLCCTHLCTTHKSILGDIYFSFPVQLYIYQHTCVM